MELLLRSHTYRFLNARRERLHVTVFGNVASLSLDRASNCTKIQYFEGVSKYCMERSLVSSFETSSSRNQTTSGDGIHLTCVLNVVDVLSKSFWKQYIVLQCRKNGIISCSKVPLCEFALSTTLGNLGVKRTFWFSSSFVFMHTTFSMRTPGCVSQKTIARYLVW